MYSHRRARIFWPAAVRHGCTRSETRPNSTQPKLRVIEYHQCPLLAQSGHAVLHLHMSASDPKRTSPASIDAAFEKKDRLTAVLLKSKVTAYQCALMRIEAGWPGSLKRFRG